MKRFSLIVTDSGPLITLAVAKSLDVLLLPRLPVIVPDMVRFEVIRDTSKPGAQAVADWIRLNEGPALRVGSTEVFEEYQALLGVRPSTKTSHRGEQAAAEILSNELKNTDHGAVLLFEDSGVRKQNFLVRLPGNVVVTSTSEFLFDLESVKLIDSAAAILRRATTLSGSEILVRQLGGTTAEKSDNWASSPLSPGDEAGQRTKWLCG